MKKIFTLFAIMVFAASLFTSCSISDSTLDAVNLKDALENKDMDKAKKLVDNIYENRKNASTEALMIEIVGLMTVGGDLMGADKKELGREYFEKFEEIYQLLEKKKDFQKELDEDKEFKSSIEMMRLMVKMMTTLDDEEGSGDEMESEEPEALEDIPDAA